MTFVDQAVRTRRWATEKLGTGVNGDQTEERQSLPDPAPNLFVGLALDGTDGGLHLVWPRA